MSDGCRTCGGPFSGEQLVCTFCGTSRERGVPAGEQRAALAQLREALQQAFYKAESKGDGSQYEVRDRFLHNAFVPSDPDVLIDAALQAHSFMVADLDTSDGPRARFETCLTRLELLAVDDPTLQKKVEILRGKLDAHRVKVRRSNVTLTVVGLVVIAVLIALGVWVVLRVFG